jgi:hypothetical protein
MGYDEGWKQAMLAICSLSARAATIAASEAESHRLLGGSQILIVAAESRRAVWGRVRDMVSESARMPRLGRTDDMPSASSWSSNEQAQGWVEALLVLVALATSAEQTAAAEVAEHRRSPGPVEMLVIAAESRRCIWACVRSLADEHTAHPPAPVMHTVTP